MLHDIIQRIETHGRNDQQPPISREEQTHRVVDAFAVCSYDSFPSTSEVSSVRDKCFDQMPRKRQARNKRVSVEAEENRLIIYSALPWDDRVLTILPVTHERMPKPPYWFSTCTIVRRIVIQAPGAGMNAWKCPDLRPGQVAEIRAKCKKGKRTRLRLRDHLSCIPRTHPSPSVCPNKKLATGNPSATMQQKTNTTTKLKSVKIPLRIKACSWWSCPRTEHRLRTSRSRR